MNNKKNIFIFCKDLTEGKASDINKLGGKGANLAEMCNLGIPVPPGITISTEVCNSFLEHNSLPKNFESNLIEYIKRLEHEVGSIFGDANNPLLFSVRSGARQSMPGMMETILNIGLSLKTIPGLITKTGNSRFVYDSYRRLIMMYADVVLEKSENLENKGIRLKLESILSEQKKSYNKTNDSDLSTSELIEICKLYKKEINSSLNKEFPDDPFEQLWGAIRAVFLSWNGQRAKKYREIESIPDNWGTAVSIQCMVFGNMGESCATGVAFTRNPSNGDINLYGEWLPNAQGEDVVSGIRTPLPINNFSKNNLTINKLTLEESFPETYQDLVKTKDLLEMHYKEMQDIEFTIQNKELWMLQTRKAKRTGAASIKIAIDMLNQNLITEEDVVNRISTSNLEEIMHPYFDPNVENLLEPIALGLPAGPGCSIGKAVFTPEDAEIYHKNGEDIILIREETSPEDIHGMHVSKGIITTRGGMTSHAALVARGWGKSCVVGCNKVEIKGNFAKVGTEYINKGDWVSINGSTGKIYRKKIDLIESNLYENDYFLKLLTVLKNNQLMGVRANADNKKDAIIAKDLGAKGIGLCRTEHMFFSPERIKEIRKMIIFRNNSEIRKRALMNLLPYQKNDFYSILKSMSPYPVTIRLLDPPLHEFLPREEKHIKNLSAQTGLSIDDINSAVLSLHENNPMLGHRGCRLGVSYPEITEMQATAILEASATLMLENVPVFPEIMIPLVGSIQEFQNQNKIIQKCAKKINSKYKIKLKHKVGTMIELPRACIIADQIAKHADFLSFGTNDLTQTTYGFSRDDISGLLSDYMKKNILNKDPFISIDIEGVGELIKIAVKKARAVNSDIKIGVCGEHGGDPKSINYFYKVGVDYVSCSPYRVPISILTASKFS
tara:strand:- start:242 stop:2926 length:2685 start_codon:yes stop_codon:yes gene_type:complete